MKCDGVRPMMEHPTFYTSDRSEWRGWLAENFDTKNEIWFVFPMKESGEDGLSYNDAVEEALCFGWIDSTIKHSDALHRIQRFSPRKKGSEYSRANIERLIWLERHGLLHPKVRETVLGIIEAPYEFPADILEAIKSDERARDNYEKLPSLISGLGLRILTRRENARRNSKSVWTTLSARRGRINSSTDTAVSTNTTNRILPQHFRGSSARLLNR